LSTSAPSSFRFRPRFRALAIGVIVFGVALVVAAAAGGLGASARPIALFGGGAAAALGALYLLSPAWRMRAVIHDDALEILSSGDRKLHLPWSEVVRVVASPSTKTCFVDGGDPARSFVVPGVGAHAPYAVERHGELYDAIIAHVPASVVKEVELLEAAVLDEQTKAAENERSGEEPAP